MLTFNGIVNRSLGFKPYKVANKTAWVKEIKYKDGYKDVFKKLPSGTVIRQAVNAKGLVCAKMALLHNGNEMQSYIGASNGSRVIHIAKPVGTGTFAYTRHHYDSAKGKLVPFISGFKNNSIYSFMYKVKMHLGIS